MRSNECVLLEQRGNRSEEEKVIKKEEEEETNHPHQLALHLILNVDNQ